MKRPHITPLAFASILTLSACGSDALDAANKYVDELCACKDVECVEKVTKKHESAFDEKAIKKIGEDKPEEVAKLGARITKCTMKHMKLPDIPAAE